MDEQTQKYFRILGYVVFIGIVILKLMDLVFPVEIEGGFGPHHGNYSVYRSEGFWMAYNIWGVILGIAGAAAIYFKQRKLVFIIMILMTMVLFYPRIGAGMG